MNFFGIDPGGVIDSIRTAFEALSPGPGTPGRFDPGGGLPSRLDPGAGVPSRFDPGVGVAGGGFVAPSLVSTPGGWRFDTDREAAFDPGTGLPPSGQPAALPGRRFGGVGPSRFDPGVGMPRSGLDGGSLPRGGFDPGTMPTGGFDPGVGLPRTDPFAGVGPPRPGSGGTTASDGSLPDGVAQWADRTEKEFSGLIDPDVMLAIMINESGGNPNAYNAKGDAWGLFQVVGLGTYDIDRQFAAAKKLAQEKLSAIEAAYKKNGLNPDTRTRARDFALAWAGHFDYATGLPNPTSKDIDSGQTAAQLSEVFLANYDRVKGGAYKGGIPSITGGKGTTMQEFGPTEYSRTHPEVYTYGPAYGVPYGSHPGLDIGMAVGTKLYVPRDGVVISAGGTGYYKDSTGDGPGKGELRIQLNDGTILILGHMRQINLKQGQRVTAGTLAGLSGDSDGPHVHIEVRVVDHSLPGGYRAVDPRSFFGGGR